MKQIRRILILFLLTICLVLFSHQTIAQQIDTPIDDTSQNQEEEITNRSYPVILDGRELFSIENGFGPVSAQQRAKNISERLQNLAQNPLFTVDALQVTSEGNLSFISADRLTVETVIMTVTDKDIESSQLDKEDLIQNYLITIEEGIENYQQSRESSNILQGIVYTIITILVWIIIFFAINFVYNFLSNIYPTLSGISIRGIEILSAKRLIHVLQITTKNITFVLHLTSVIIAITLILGFFPATKNIGLRVWAYCLNSLTLIAQALLNYLPNLFIIVIIIAITYYFLRFIKPIFDEIEKGSLFFPGFYAEWAQPTYIIVELLIFAVSGIMIFPYLPGFGSAAFQNISILLGVLVSLGSTNAVSNAVSGIILIYTRAFQIGDRVKLSHHLGDIEEKSLLVTRIRTFENILITIPNSNLLNNEIINYSASIRETRRPVILTAVITLGYDVPWENVYETLITSALNTQYVLENPLPFVLQTGLGDFSVTYELKVYTNYPTKMELIYSELHQNMQDKCNEADIEILSPTYSAVRDGNTSTIPETYLPKNYAPEGFLVNPIGNLFQIDLDVTPNKK